MTRQVSLQRRLGIGLSLGVTLLWLLAATGAGLVLRHELDEAFDSALQETAQRLLPLAVSDISERERRSAPRRVTPLKHHREVVSYLVRDPSGRVLLQSHDADPSHFPSLPAAGFHTTASHRTYGEAAAAGSLIIEVAEPLGHRRRAAFEAAALLFLPLAFLIPLSLLAVWALLRRSLRPVLALKSEIEARGGRDLSPVSAAALPVEVGPIAEAVNRLMERLRRTLQAERSFTANSAHELRTPIAATLAQAQRLVAEAPPGQLRDRAQRIEQSLRELGQRSEKLLQLAKAEGGSLLGEQAEDLAVILDHVVEAFRRQSDVGSRVVLHRMAGRPVLSHLDPDAFAILLRNLIENALKHGPSGGPVEVSLAEDGLVRVVNGGPVVAPAALSRLKERFERGATRASGAGLGLAIAEAIASGAGTRLDLASPARQRADGFEVSFRLPA